MILRILASPLIGILDVLNITMFRARLTQDYFTLEVWLCLNVGGRFNGSSLDKGICNRPHVTFGKG